MIRDESESEEFVCGFESTTAAERESGGAAFCRMQMLMCDGYTRATVPSRIRCRRLVLAFLAINLLMLSASFDASLASSSTSLPAPFNASAQRRKSGRGQIVAASSQASARSIIISTQPSATVWLDEVRRGATDASGQLALTSVAAGRHTLRVRALGFAERTLPLLPTQRGRVEVRLTRTTDEAELAFQQAEAASEKPGEEARAEAVKLYRRALQLRPKFPAARVGLARVLLAMDDHDGALAEIAAARRARPGYPEASAVEGRIHRDMALNDQAIASYERAIREARGFQPEAHTGLGIMLEDKGDHEGAVRSFRKAIEQLSDSEPALYQLIGAAYEKLEKYKEAVAAYEKYLQLAPEGRNASAIRSIIDQLRVQADEQLSPSPN